jgi:murein DD-endopeptidase MepM/ murein hydrolase activator NlpD
MYNLYLNGNTFINKVFKEDYMRRDIRKHEKTISDKIIMYSMIGGVALTVILIGLLMYSKGLKDDVKQGTLNLGEMANMTNTENTESASTEMGKSVEEAKNEIKDTNNTNSTNSTNQTNTSNKIAINTSNMTNTHKNTNSNVVNQSNVSKTTNADAKKQETKKELSFTMPVEGEISREFAKDSLVHSETLKEWVTHMGIDIKADKTTVVKAAESGIVKSIKNDPRYGLTIVIDHGDGIQTIYANLLTSEFVVEGENVEKGQSIGTVGNTAVFEIADEPHLHFEILKDSIPQDPNAYLN